MTEPFIGEIQIFGFNFAPRSWAYCDGSLLSISQNTTLFSLLGTNYGGDGRVTFGLPNFQGQASCNQGQGPGLTPRTIGESFGSPNVTLLQTDMPGHQHGVVAFAQTDVSKRASSPSPGNGLFGLGNSGAYAAGSSTTQPFSPVVIGATGGNMPHDNTQPYLAMNFCIALQGIYPSFN
jgi:microcystin-dependent protein